MTAEKLHEAITLLPGDLITAVDRVRSHPRRAKAALNRWASLAACLAVLLLGGLALKTMLASGLAKSSMAAPAANADAAEEKALASQSVEAAEEAESPEARAGTNGVQGAAVSAQGFLTPPLQGKTTGPQVAILRSREELDAYCAAYADAYDLTALLAGSTGWEEAYFAENDLLLVVLEGPESACPQPQSLRQAEPTGWELTFIREDAAGDALWHILIPIPKDRIPPEDTVTVHWEEE